MNQYNYYLSSTIVHRAKSAAEPQVVHSNHPRPLYFLHHFISFCLQVRLRRYTRTSRMPTSHAFVLLLLFLIPAKVVVDQSRRGSMYSRLLPLVCSCCTIVQKFLEYRTSVNMLFIPCTRKCKRMAKNKFIGQCLIILVCNYRHCQFFF